MIKITLLMAVCTALAWVSEVNTNKTQLQSGQYRMHSDLAFVLLAVIMTLFSGLRTSYNDTWTYMNSFRNDGGLAAFFSDPKNLNPFRNSLFYLFQSALRELTGEAQWLIFLSSAFIQICFLRFFKQYSRHFALTVFLYFTLGTFGVSLGAIKQTLAMAILTLGFPLLERGKVVRYLLVVLIAALFHTYAVCFAVLPLFSKKPWSLFTFLFIGGTTLVLMNFRSVIEEFMEQANSLGKTLESYEVFHDHTVNLFRVAVYLVAPAFSLVFAPWLNERARRIDHILIHMSIISMAFMLMGTQAGANMFARMAHYFEIGTLCCLPEMIDKPFDKASAQLVTVCAVFAFLFFFAYANLNFDSAFQSTTILRLFGL